ncbi:MAG TPA: sigma-70 family RNA polymerase sigma factor [Chitinophagaceae bacterium]|nr:sigma-70 family RNA polymerase sigma factor [Chitinophagaceae bacterium]
MKDKLFRVALGVIGDRREAEDIVQEVMMRIWERRESWDEIENLQGYCIRMARNMSIDRNRSKQGKEAGLDRAGEIFSRDGTPFQNLERREAMAHIGRFMESLPEKQKTAIRLREIEGMSYLDIAASMEIPMDQVKITLYRARTALKNALLKLEGYGLH